MKLLIIQHHKDEGLGYFEFLLNKMHVDYEYARVFEGELPENIERYSGLIIMGGPMNVYEEDKYPWLKEEDRLIKVALREKIPILGICLGAQLIAKAAGARVIKSPKKEIGWFDIQLTPHREKDELFSQLPRGFKVFQWHGDTFEIPEGGERLAGSKDVPNQAFRHGMSYGLQFHIEMDRNLINSWMAHLPPDEDGHEFMEIIQETRENLGELNRIAEIILLNFLKKI